MSTIVSLDLETRTLTDSSEDALFPHLSEITCVGVWCPEFDAVFRDLNELRNFIHDNPNLLFIGHNFQFDLKHLAHKNIHIPMERWVGDTKVMASLLNKKIPESWLKKYDERRAQLNKELPRGYSHRSGSQHSLKTLAPYFLEVDPFWEDPKNHDNDEYVLKDCEYTYKLYEKFTQELEKEGLLGFYNEKSHEWARMLTKASLEGVTLDLEKMRILEKEVQSRAYKTKEDLDARWFKAYSWLRDRRAEKLKEKYKTQKGYLAAIDRLPHRANLSSPSQLLEILRDYFKYDITDFGGKESTGKEVLQKLSETHEDVKLLYNYRRDSKLLTSFFPTYHHLNDGGILRGSFNVEGTRTGRVSASHPNLQQQPAEMHQLFVARPGHKLITRDLSAIEPRLCAYLTEDPLLCRLMIEGGDFHSTNAVIMFDLDVEASEVKEKYPYERKVAKEVGLALLYGAGPKRIQQSAMKYGFNWTLGQCKIIHKRFKETYKTAFQFKQNLDRRAEADEPIINLFGRVHYYHNKDDIFMKAFNSLIQSSASDLLLDSQVKCMREYKKRGLNAKLLLVVHDECVTECEDKDVTEVERIIEKNMTGYELKTKFGVIPLSVEGGTGREWLK